jgi:hypothetical protein
MMRVRVDGARPPVELMREKTNLLTPMAWSPDRRYVLFMKILPKLGVETLLFPVDDPTRITPLLTGPANDFGVTFSPDGRWLAFTSDRSGRPEAYVVRFRGDQSPPALGGHPLKISTDEGFVLGWRRDGRAVLIGTRDEYVMAVPIDARGETITAGPPGPLFKVPLDRGAVAMAPDGDRFLVTEYPYSPGQTIRVLTNWHERLK